MIYRNNLLLFILALMLGSVQVTAQTPLTLRDAIQKGLENNYQLKMYAKEVDISGINNSWGAAGAYPTVTLSASGLVSDDLSTTTLTGQASVDVRWTLFSGFLIKTTKSILANNEEFSKGTEMLQTENMIASIMRAYYSVKLSEEVLKVSEEVLKISDDRYQQDLHAQEIGTKGVYEIIQSRNALLEDTKEHIQQQLNLRNSIRNLNLILGLEPSEEWLFSDTIPGHNKTYSLSEMKERMKRDNISMRNQYINLKARDLEIKQNESGRYPSLSLSAGVAVNGNGLKAHQAEMTHNSTLRPNAGITLNYNIFNNGKVQRNIHIAQINKEIEAIQTDDMLLSLNKELTAALDAYDTYLVLRKNSEEQLDVARINLALSSEKYHQGTINSFDYRYVQLSYLRSAISHIQIRHQLLVTDIDLLQLSGGILTSGQ